MSLFLQDRKKWKSSVTDHFYFLKFLIDVECSLQNLFKHKKWMLLTFMATSIFQPESRKMASKADLEQEQKWLECKNQCWTRKAFSL